MSYVMWKCRTLAGECYQSVWQGHRKTHPTKASQQEFLATCIDVDVEKNVKYQHRQKYTIKRGHRNHQSKHDSTVQCQCLCALSNVLRCAERVNTPPPPGPTHTFLKWPFLTDFKKYIHNPTLRDDTFAVGSKTFKRIPKSAKTHKIGTF